nr:acyl-CoA dehydrogenase family protein [Antrihabitans stalactiti]
MVDAAAAGVHIEEVDSADPATEFARVTFNEVHAEAAAFGPAAEALVTRIRSWARLLIACELSGVAHRSLERTIEYLSQRRQFDRPIGSFQAVKHIAADMHTRWAGLHNLCVASLDNADHASAADLDILAATAKAHAALTAILICEDAIQLHGGMGFTTESDVSWYYKRALALRSWYGDDTELQLKVGTALLHIAPATTTTDSGRDDAPAQVGGRK